MIAAASRLLRELRVGLQALVLALPVQDAAPPPAETSSRPRSVLLVTLDTTRRDFMGFMGRTPSPTPNLDRFAQESLVFDDAYTVAPLTVPAHASLLTGLYPGSHGVRDNTSFKLPQAARTLAEVLRDHGYSTGAAVAVFVLDATFALDQGFQSYDAPAIERHESFFTERRADDMVDRAARDLVRLAGQAPFFYWLHLYDPHFPYAPPGGAAPDVGTAADPHRLARHLYDGEVRFADAQIGRLLDLLRERGIDQDLVTVIASDHGESLGDALESSHGFFLFDPLVRIPLLLRAPGLAPRRVGTPVSLVDVVPTLLDLLGIAEPALPTDGVDLAPMLRDPASEPPDRALLLESRFGWLNYGWAPFEGCVWRGVKLLRSNHLELFEPGAGGGARDETKNAIARDDVRAQALVRRLEELVAHPALRLERDALLLPEADLAELARLGYTAGGGPADAPPDGATLPDAYEKIGVMKELEKLTRARLSGDTDGVLELLRGLVAREPQSALLQEELGFELASRGPDHFDEAERCLNAALAIEPRRARTHLELAHCAERRAEALRARLKQLREQGEARGSLQEPVAEERLWTRRAIGSYRTCLEFEPRLPDAIARLARMLGHEAERAERAARTADPRGALELFREADQLIVRWLALVAPDDPDRSAVERYRASILDQAGKLEKLLPPLLPPPPPKIKDGRFASGGELLAEQAAFDVRHCELRIEVDPESRTIQGRLTMTARARARLGNLVLDLDDALAVSHCASGDAPLAFVQQGGMVSIALPRWFAAGEDAIVSVDYGGAPRVAPNAPWDGGFTWAKTADGRPWIATSCQIDGADLWWPCKDHPSDKAESFDLLATVPGELVCAANGKLVDDARNDDGTHTFHWRLDTPVSNYCIALNIAPYQVIRDEYTSVTGETIPVWFFVTPEHLEQGRAALPAFLRDMRCFEELCGPYPFRAEKYGVAETPHLGMEHATITAYGNRFRADPDGYDWLHNHEFAHEWWANLVTCRDWKDMWIHEGIGTCMQALFLEQTRGHDALVAEMRRQRRGLRNRRPVAPREVQDSREAYDGDVYGKGACFMHSLRWVIGDEKFFVALRRMAYPDPALERVTDGSQIRFSDTEEIRAIAEKVAGGDLGWLFEVYLRQAALPELAVLQDDTELTLEWKAPAGLPFPMPLPVRIDGTTRRVELPEGRARLPIPAGAKVEIDPEGWVLRK